MFFPPRYIIRVFKSILYFVIVFAVILIFIFLLSEKRDASVTLFDLIAYPKEMAGFIVLFGIVYPLMSFVKKNALLTRTFSEERINILNIFDSVGYELASEKNGVLTFRLKNRVTRFMRLFYEDMIEVEYNDGSVSLTGLRRDVYRLTRYIEYLNNKDL
ncbi:MAG: hypothetical protein LBT50_09125 [Prevotellaceae bacterium]|nr:hypothetical protein [Prevotellaceae bacterium]